MAYIGRDLQYGVLDKQTLTGANSVKTVWNDLSYGVASASNLLVSVGGLIQEPEVAYTASGTTLTFVDAPTAADTVYIIFLGKELAVATAQSNLSYQTGTGDGTDTTPIAVLNKTVPTNESIMVMLDGVTQVPGTDYSVSGTTLTFTTAPANGVDILVYFLGVVRNIGTPSDGTVTNAKIVDVDASKLTGTLNDILLKDYGEVTNAIGSTGGGTQDIDITLGNVITATVDTSTNTFTFTNPTASDEGCSFTIVLTNGGSQTVNWPATVDWKGGTAPTLTAAGVDILVFLTVDGGTRWHGFAASLDSK